MTTTTVWPPPKTAPATVPGVVPIPLDEWRSGDQLLIKGWPYPVHAVHHADRVTLSVITKAMQTLWTGDLLHKEPCHGILGIPGHRPTVDTEWTLF